MKQSEFQQLHVTCSKGRKKSRVQGALGFGFASRCWKNRDDIFKANHQVQQSESRYYFQRSFENCSNRLFIDKILKLPTGISERKICLPFATFTSTKLFSNSDACHVSLIRVLQMVYANTDRKFSLRIFAYHLHKPSTNRFSHVSGKQPQSQYLLSTRSEQSLLLSCE